MKDIKMYCQVQPQNQHQHQQQQQPQQSQQQQPPPQQQQHQHSNHNPQNMVQVQVQNNMVSVIEDNKDQKDLINAQLQAAQLQINENHLNQQALTVQQLQQLQVQQVLDNVVSSFNVFNFPIYYLLYQRCVIFFQDLKGANLMDVRTADGSIVKIQTNMHEQELVKTLGVDIVQNMYKVNVDDLNQLLAYHEIFGKLQGTQSRYYFLLFIVQLCIFCFLVCYILY